MEKHVLGAAAFVEGGIQDAFEDDTCSICLDSFSHYNPSTMTCCKHEYHLQCILEWCQRSSQCPMCWQAIAMQDPISQDLLNAVEKERSINTNQPRNATLFHLAAGSNGNYELEERIMQQLAYISRRERLSNRTSAYVCPRYVDSSAPTSSTTSERSEDESVDVSEFSYIRESITKTTRGWRERLLNRSISISETMSRLLERVRTNNNAAASASAAYVRQNHVIEESKNEAVSDTSNI